MTDQTLPGDEAAETVARAIYSHISDVCASHGKPPFQSFDLVPPMERASWMAQARIAIRAYLTATDEGRALVRDAQLARTVLRLEGPWPLSSIIKTLADAADHLLDHHSCDTHGHEGIRHAANGAREWLQAAIAAQDQQT